MGENRRKVTQYSAFRDEILFLLRPFDGIALDFGGVRYQGRREIRVDHKWGFQPNGGGSTEGATVKPAVCPRPVISCLPSSIPKGRNYSPGMRSMYIFVDRSTGGNHIKTDTLYTLFIALLPFFVRPFRGNPQVCDPTCTAV